MNAFFVATLLAFVAVSGAQRPFYAGLNPIGYPELADRFKTDEDTVTPAPVDLANRVGEGAAAVGATQATVPTTTVRLPVDALGDQKLVDRISKWPRDKQPYWYLNWQLIEEHRRQRPGMSGSNQNFPPSGNQNFQPAGNQNFQPAENQNFQPAGNQNVQPAGNQNFQQQNTNRRPFSNQDRNNPVANQNLRLPNNQQVRQNSGVPVNTQQRF